MEVIILDGEQKSALAAVRSLSRHGIRCIVGSSRKTGMALHSRYTAETFVYTHPLKDKATFLDQVLVKCSARSEKPILLAFSDASFLPLARERTRVLACAHMALPSPESIEIAFDKALTMDLAERIGIPIPQTRLIKKGENLEILEHKLGFPLIIKPRHSATWKERQGVSGSVIFAFSNQELNNGIDAIEESAGELPIVEECIVGDEYGIEVMVNHGTVVQWFAHKRIRSLSPTGGASVVKESISLPDDLKEYTQRLMKELLWHGPAMIEFKRDSKQGNKAYLLEVNGRFWGSLPLAVCAGVDFPFLYIELIYGVIQNASIPYKSQVVTRYFLGDVKHILRVLFARDPMRSIAYPSRLKALRNFCIVSPHTHYDVLSLRDPLPFFADVVNHLIQ